MTTHSVPTKNGIDVYLAFDLPEGQTLHDRVFLERHNGRPLHASGTKGVTGVADVITHSRYIEIVLSGPKTEEGALMIGEDYREQLAVTRHPVNPPIVVDSLRVPYVEDTSDFNEGRSRSLPPKTHKRPPVRR